MSTTTNRDEAIDWLVGQLRWETIMRDLHAQAEGVEPVAPVVELGQAHADEQDEAAA